MRRSVRRGENPWNSIVPSALADSDFEQTRPPRLLTHPFRTASVVLVFVVDLKVVASTDQYLDRVGVISGASIYPFVWNVLLGVRQAGFGGTITTLAVSRESGIQGPARHPRATSRSRRSCRSVGR